MGNRLLLSAIGAVGWSHSPRFYTPMTNDTTLEPIVPTEAKRLWLESHIDEWADATMQLQRFHVDEFTEWLAEREIDDMRDVSGRTVHRFRLDIKEGLAQSTLSQRISTVQRFLSFCASIDAIDPSVPERIEQPSRGRDVRDEKLGDDQAEAALSYLQKYAYASREHALLALTWHTGLRSGTLVALDVADVEASQNRLRVRHRPDDGTPLKNGTRAERYVAISSEITEILQDYIDTQRVDVRDGADRRPLFTTEHGRAPVKTLRRWFQSATRPCLWGECPHGRAKADCDAAQTASDASDCPSSVSGHPVRRGAITRFLKDDVPHRAVSDRCNVTQDVLDKHYDARTEGEKTEQRREYFD
ncbi:tyrosine-type recombinase/integrase [Haloarcula sediminis]